jgi:two-component system NtrC family sensor kinase
MKLSNRIFFSFLGIILFSGLGSTILGAVLIVRAVESEAFSRLDSDLRTARIITRERLDELAYHAQSLAIGITESIAYGNEPHFSVLIPPEGNADQRRFLDYLTDRGGIPARDSLQGFITLPLELLRPLDFDADRVDANSLCENGLSFWAFAVHHGPEGTAFSGMLLNGNRVLVTELQTLLYGREYYGDKPFGTVTVFCGDKRVATTVIGPRGDVAIGTRVSDVVRRKVLDEGDVWLDRAYVVDEWYLSAYEPIQGPGGENIGILYVGVLEKRYLDIQRRAMLLLSGITLPTLGLLLFVVFLISKRIVKPVSTMADASKRIAKGELDTQVEASSGANELDTLARAFNRMAAAIEKREQSIRGQNVELEEANRDYRELLSFVTHELNNSVGSLLLNVSMLADGTLGPIEGEQRETVEQILRDVERFRDMVHNYLNISRLEKGTLKYNPGLIDVRKMVVVPVVNRLSSRIEHRGMELFWDWDVHTPVFADNELLDICFSNLLVNAVKYGESWIRIRAKVEAGGFVFGIENGGAPIPEEKIPVLFQKFSRLVQSSDGAGLGLYLVRKIVERHGGSVWCTSSPGKGTGFYMAFPDHGKGSGYPTP